MTGSSTSGAPSDSDGGHRPVKGPPTSEPVADLAAGIEDGWHGTEMLRGPSSRVEAGSCPRCAARRAHAARFCDVCGLDYAGEGGEQLAAVWEVDVIADRELFDQVAPLGLTFPTGREMRTFRLGDKLDIGRQSESGGSMPEIDLSGELADPAASHRHARLTLTTDGRCQVIDHGSTNGTTINAGSTPITPDVPVVLENGDHLHIGAWTTIVVRRVG